MFSKNVLIPAAIILAATLVAALLIIARPDAAEVELTIKPRLVDVQTVHKTTRRVSVKAQGTVSPRTETTLISEVSGQVVAVAKGFVPGGFFRQGDVLLEIDRRNYETQLKRAEAAVATARSQLAQEQGRALVARQDWQKRNDTRHISPAARALALREPQLQEAQANLESALADLENAGTDLARTIIRAPYDGLVRSKLVDVGQYLSPGTALGVTFAIDEAEIRLALPENRIEYLRLPDAFAGDEQSAPVYLSEENQNRHWEARLVRTEGVLDSKRRVLFAVARVTDPYGLHREQSDEDNFVPLRIGTFVDAVIEGREFPGLIQLPRNILRAGNKLWVVDEDNALQERVVETLRTDGQFIYVTAGLADGERVCITSLGPTLPGSTVRINQVLSDPEAPLLGSSE